MIECPDCDFSHEKNGIVFTHRVKTHTDAGDGKSFDLYDEEVFEIYQEMAVNEAIRNAKDSGDDDVTVPEMKQELRELGVHLHDDLGFETFSEDVEI